MAPLRQHLEDATLECSTQEVLLNGDEDELAIGWASSTPSSSPTSSADEFYTPLRPHTLVLMFLAC